MQGKISHLQGSKPSSWCMTAFGIKTSTHGLLKCLPQLPNRYDRDNPKIETVSQRYLPKSYAIQGPNLKKQRYQKQRMSAVRSEAKKPRHDWDLVVSEARAITGFHTDSHSTGSLIHQLFGSLCMSSNRKELGYL